MQLNRELFSVCLLHSLFVSNLAAIYGMSHDIHILSIRGRPTYRPQFIRVPSVEGKVDDSEDGCSTRLTSFYGSLHRHQKLA
jgi:hypothetical protein